MICKILESFLLNIQNYLMIYGTRESFVSNLQNSSSDLQDGRRFRIGCRKPLDRLHNPWEFCIESTDLSRILYLVCRTFWSFARNIRNSREFRMKYTKPYVVSETILESAQYWRNFQVVSPEKNETFLTLRNLKTLSERTTKRFSFHKTENSSLDKWRTLKVW